MSTGQTRLCCVQQTHKLTYTGTRFQEPLVYPLGVSIMRLEPIVQALWHMQALQTMHVFAVGCNSDDREPERQKAHCTNDPYLQHGLWLRAPTHLTTTTQIRQNAEKEESVHEPCTQQCH